MRLVTTDSVQPGTILAKSIYNEKGQVLLNEGIELKEGMLDRLLSLGITYIYIKDGLTDDLIINNPIPDQLRTQAIQSIETTFQQVQNIDRLTGSFVIEKASKKFKELIRFLLTEIKSNQDLLTLLSDVYTYDNYIFTHSLNVTMYSLAIGMEMKLTPKELEALGLGAILHDVGKMKIPTEILFKPGKLTKEEYDQMKTHAEAGFQILRNVDSISLLVAHCAYQHHERIDGSGYPRGINGEQIHPFGKIIAVADVFDAVTSNRVYRKAMLPHDGLEILYSGVGNLFETKVVEAFRRAVAIYPVGITVLISDGRKGVVCRQNIGLSDRPVVRILEEDGVEIAPYELDLASHLSLVITDCDTTFQKE